MSALTYRLLTLADVDIFRTLRLQALSDTPEAFCEAYEEIVEKPIEVFKQHFDNGWIAGAFIDNALAGMAGLFRHKGRNLRHKGTVWGVYVAPQARGRGCGRSLIEMVMDEARKAGIEHVLLSTNAANPVTVKLYENLGFTAYGVEKHMIKIDGRYIDEVHMIRFL